MENVPILAPMIVEGELHISQEQISAWQDWLKRASDEQDHLEEQIDAAQKFLTAAQVLGFDAARGEGES